jgi:hypothetical protein
VKRIYAIFLSLVFLFGGNGLSVDLAQCCSSISGIAIGFSQAHNHSSTADECCFCSEEISEKEENCCSEIIVQTVINQNLAKQGKQVSQYKIFKPIAIHPMVVVKNNSISLDNLSFCDNFDHNYPVPILIKKRVLQI